MKYKFLGKSGLRVSELCLGAMTFGEAWKGGGTTEQNAIQIFNAFEEAGGNFIDTANIYTAGTSERILAKLMEGKRHKFVLGTKYTITTDPSNPNASGNSRKNMMNAVEESLRRLNTDFIDIYWVHLWDGVTPYDEVMRGLEDLVRSGKVLYLGASDMPAWVVSQSNVLAELRGWAQFSAIQIEYNLAERTPEADLIPMAESHGLSILDWAPLKMGMLTGKYLPAGNAANESRLSQPSFVPELQANYLNDVANNIAAEVVNIAKEIGKSAAQVAINWILRQSPLHIPIIGAKTVRQFQDNLGAVDFELTSDQISLLNQISQPHLSFPHNFLAMKSTQEMLLIPNYEENLDRPERSRNLIQKYTNLHLMKHGIS